MIARLSSETLHASTVAHNGRGVLLSGPSGSGKSDLALQLLERGYALVSDDQTVVSKNGSRLYATAPHAIAGRLEVRGLGIVDMPAVSDVPLCLVVELTSDIQRYPDDSRERQLLGLGVPLISVDARTASAAAKITVALDRLGLSL